jgi:hypothetical protein
MLLKSVMKIERVDIFLDFHAQWPLRTSDNPLPEEFIDGLANDKCTIFLHKIVFLLDGVREHVRLLAVRSRIVEMPKNTCFPYFTSHAMYHEPKRIENLCVISSLGRMYAAIPFRGIAGINGKINTCSVLQ